jgi:TetR/AcrR family transcriptional regulator, cholesterol catabolism regulator
VAIPADSRSRILEAATDLFVRNGFHGTGVRELSEAVGIGSGTLYHHIGSKERLLFEITMSLLESAIAQAREITAADADPEQTVRTLARALLEHHATHGDAWSVALQESGSLSEENRSLVVAARDEYESLWRAQFDRGARAGRWRRLKSIEVRGILGMLNSVPRWMSPAGSLTPAKIADCYIDLILRGIEPRPNAGTASGKGRRTRRS